MGSSLSTKFSDLFPGEDIVYSYVSNSPDVRFRRVLEEDPRSPTVGITRTPIQVEKTPDLLLDPRSPSQQILRTPIYGAPINGTPIRRICSVSDLDLTAEISFRNLDLQLLDDSQDAELNRSNSEPSLNISSAFNDSKDSPFVMFKDVDNCQENSKNPSSNFANNTSETNHTNTDKENNPGNKLTKSPRSPLKVISVMSSGSPKSNRTLDYDSPRNIVHRKQLRKVAKLKSANRSARNASVLKDHQYSKLDDKENVN